VQHSTISLILVIGTPVFSSLRHFAISSLLLKKGYSQIISLGSVAGSNKVRKGTPDTLTPTNDGKYVFAEYTTISERQVYSLLITQMCNTAQSPLFW
jgi:hypothetical protein